MTGLQHECTVHCPYCGEAIDVLIDTSVETQCYIEDCEVCCRPIEFECTSNNGALAALAVRRSD